jgi:hypothetical protein
MVVDVAKAATRDVVVDDTCGPVPEATCLVLEHAVMVTSDANNATQRIRPNIANAPSGTDRCGATPSDLFGT